MGLLQRGTGRAAPKLELADIHITVEVIAVQVPQLAIFNLVVPLISFVEGLGRLWLRITL